MDREELKQIVADQREVPLPKAIIERTQAEVIRFHMDDPNILIITGIKRSGKSTTLRLLQRECTESDHYINFDDERLVHFTADDFEVLLEVFKELFGKQSTLFFDEIQTIDGWEHVVDRLYNEGNKVVITSSNSSLLRPLLSGRSTHIELYPLSFREIVLQEFPEDLTKNALSASDLETLVRLISEYSTHGGFPEFFTLRNQEYLKDLYQGIIYRDILAQHNITHKTTLRKLVHYFAGNIGNEFSYTKLATTVGLSSPHTVSSYCDYLEQTYLCLFISRYSPSLQKQIQHNKKCYLTDPALIRALGFGSSEDWEHMLENIVFINLKMHGLKIYFHKETYECDFVIQKYNDIFEAIQVTSHPTHEKIEGLLEAMKAYGLQEGLLITENQEETLKFNSLTIKVIPLWKWLLSFSSNW